MHTENPSPPKPPLDEWEQFALDRLTEEKRKSHHAMTDRSTDGILSWARFCGLRMESALLVLMADDYSVCHRMEQQTDEERRRLGLPMPPEPVEVDINPDAAFEPFREAFSRISRRYAKFIIASGPRRGLRGDFYRTAEKAVNALFWRAILEEVNDEMRQAKLKADPALDVCKAEPCF